MTRIPWTLVVLCVLVALAAGQSHRPCQLRDPSACPQGEYCALAFGQCGDLSGTCEDVPTQCGDIYVPVCGCDGRNYDNYCKASQHAVSVRSLGACPSGPQEPCPELRELCDQLEERVDLYASQLYANQGLGAPLDYARVNWTAVEQYIATNNFRVEDYSLTTFMKMVIDADDVVMVQFSSAGVYSNIRTYWRALNTANSLFPLVEASVDWTTCDPFARRVVSQHREVYGRARWGGPIEKETSTSLYVFEFEPNGLRITKQAFWTSANLADLVGDDKAQR